MTIQRYGLCLCLALVPWLCGAQQAKPKAKAPPTAQGTETAKFVKAAKLKLEQTLKDPGSVQYRGLFVSKQAGTGELILCGEVNSKNSFGGYSGFEQFISSTGSMVYIGGQIDALLPEYCSDKIADVK